MRIRGWLSSHLGVVWAVAFVVCGVCMVQGEARAAAPSRGTGTNTALPGGTRTSGTGGARQAAVKPTAKGKNASAGKTQMADWSAADTRGAWQMLDRNEETCEAFLTGSWADLATGKLTARDFQLVSPPDLGAALGLATVYGPDTAGWFVAGGRRVHVRTTDARRNNTTLSYESLARLAWAAGVAKDARPCARILWGKAALGSSMPLETFCAKAVDKAPRTGAWLVAGLAEFSTLRGRALERSPAGTSITSMSASGNGERPFFQTASAENRRALFVALMLDSKRSSEAARSLAGRFFPPDPPVVSPGGFLLRTHYACFALPGPRIDPTKPFQAIWNAHNRTQLLDLPHVTTVREALEGTRIAKAYVSVYAISAVVPYALYQKPELMDPTEKDPSILIEQRLATANTPIGEPVYERPRILLRKPVAEAILRISRRARQQGCRLKIYDAYRPLSVSQRLYAKHPDVRYLAAPNVGSRHNRGAALDLTLTDSQGREIEMPSDYLTFDTRSHRNSPGMTAAARKNMELLTSFMATERFTTINEEWWHYDAPNWEQYPVMDEPLWPEHEPGAKSANGITTP